MIRVTPKSAGLCNNQLVEDTSVLDPPAIGPDLRIGNVDVGGDCRFQPGATVKATVTGFALLLITSDIYADAEKRAVTVCA